MQDDKIKMNVTGLTIDPFTNMPIVILKDDDQNIALPIWIGLVEASAIATEIEAVQVSRPMTHDLLKVLLGQLNARLTHVEIVDLTDKTFFANLHIEADGQTKVIDCRPSDAIALALREKCDILVDKQVIEKSREIESFEATEEDAQSEKWTEILENLTQDDFGKYKM